MSETINSSFNSIPSSANSAHGMLVEPPLRELTKSDRVDARVLEPVPWSRLTHAVLGDNASFAATPRLESRHGLLVSPPRYLAQPKIEPQLSFEHVGEDRGAAISAMQPAQPSIRRFVPPGLCDSASAALLITNATRDTSAVGSCVVYAWGRSDLRQTRKRLKHDYMARLPQREFWRKFRVGKVTATALREFLQNNRIVHRHGRRGRRHGLKTISATQGLRTVRFCRFDVRAIQRERLQRRELQGSDPLGCGMLARDAAHSRDHPSAGERGPQLPGSCGANQSGELDPSLARWASQYGVALHTFGIDLHSARNDSGDPALVTDTRLVAGAAFCLPTLIDLSPGQFSASAQLICTQPLSTPTSCQE